MRVIVTRPEREAHAWVQALSHSAHEVLALPLLVIRAVSQTLEIRAAWRAAGGYTALMFVSGSAVEHFFALKSPQDVEFGRTAALKTRAWATGPGTASALLRHGVDAKCIDAPAPGSGQFDSEALWTVVAARICAGDSVLIVRGADTGPNTTDRGVAESAPAVPGWGRDWLAQRLVHAGVRVDSVVVYERAAPVWNARQQDTALAATSDGSVWLFTSARAVANLTVMLPRQNWGAARALATHARIAGAARSAGFGVVWESRPTVADVVASIESNA